MITFNYIRFGNFSYINRKIINKITKKKDLWFAYSATINKYFKFRNSIKAPRRKRISGKSKMSYLGLINHSLNIQSAYLSNIIFAYFIYSLILFLILSHLTLIFILISLLHIFLITMIRYKINNDNLNFDNCLKNIK